MSDIVSNNTTHLLAKLDELKIVMVANSIPFNYRWLDAEGVAAMMCVSVGHFRERIACKPKFPKPSRPTGGHPRWKAAEIEEWMVKQVKAA